MANERLFLCGETKIPKRNTYPKKIKKVKLLLSGKEQNITLKIKDITRKMVAELPPIYEDLIEIATYVYCADQAVPRGGSGARSVGANWRRNMYFLIAVRNPRFWNRKKVRETLIELLDFLSDDNYEFRFTKLTKPPSISEYLEFPDDDVGYMADEIVLFSGGLDSLAGAIKEVLIDKKRVALISHRSAPKIAPKQKALYQEIANRSERGRKPHHVPVWIQKNGWREVDTSQRSRSFLYAALAACVAAMFKKKRIRFYENGVTSINLPINGQVVGARATRTTHPKAIAGFTELFSLVSESKFKVETPFLWKTKADIVGLIEKSGHADLIKHAVSCSHVFEMTKLHTHCGGCSQCIDRRLAMLAVGCEEHDPAEMYKTDVFIGERTTEGQEVVMIESYVRSAKESANLSEIQLFSKYGELSRVVTYIAGHSDEAAGKVYDLITNNGKQVVSAISRALQLYADDFAQESIPDCCLLRQLIGAKAPEVANDDIFISLVEAADILKVNKGTITRWANDGKIRDNGEKGQNRKVSKASALLIKHEREQQDLLADYEDYKRGVDNVPDMH